MVTGAGFFGFFALAISLYLWIFDDPSQGGFLSLGLPQWLPVIGSAVFLVFLGGVAVLF